MHNSLVINAFKTYAFEMQNNRFFNALIARGVCDSFGCENIYSLVALFSFKREVVVSDCLLFLCFGCEMKNTF
ncbi:hypothetical protein CTM62_11170 [Prevotella intermedia]|uniref:Uncharacterized protein n=1 Tax=Prevotella intermedia TaxID=28131 RepID=A0A2D3L9X2_PREIN|nr:hypothetical protein CTM62_11170 [Prevotella intermedia]